jgi:hypothetical protein
MRSAGVGLLALIVAMAAFVREARAQNIDATPLAASELESMRGGFLLPTGIEANFGAIARTYSDGVLVLESRFTWTADGVVRDDLIASSALTPTDVLANGFMLTDESGAATFAHQIDDGGIRNILLNEANGRDFHIDTQFTVTLPDFAATQQDFSNARLALHLFADMQASLH